MGKIISICQPNFLPWLGYFEMAHRADVFVMLDDVQYVRREWINRNRILNRSVLGWQWIIVPLEKNNRGSMIKNMKIFEYNKWKTKLIKTLEHTYAKSPYFKEYMKKLSRVFVEEWTWLVDLNIALIKLINNLIGIDDNLVRSSDLRTRLGSDDKLVEICKVLQGDIYLANNGSKPYIDMSKFHKEKIGFVYQNYIHPNYTVKDFVFKPYLSVIDLLFWHGPKALEIIISGRNRKWQNEIRYQ